MLLLRVWSTFSLRKRERSWGSCPWRLWKHYCTLHISTSLLHASIRGIYFLMEWICGVKDVAAVSNWLLKLTIWDRTDVVKYTPWMASQNSDTGQRLWSASQISSIVLGITTHKQTFIERWKYRYIYRQYHLSGTKRVRSWTRSIVYISWVASIPPCSRL